MNKSLENLKEKERSLAKKIKELKRERLKKMFMPLCADELNDNCINATIAELVSIAGAGLTTNLTVQGISDSSIFTGEQFILAVAVTLYAAGVMANNSIQTYKSYNNGVLQSLQLDLDMVKEQIEACSDDKNLTLEEQKNKLLAVKEELLNINGQLEEPKVISKVKRKN